MATDREIRDEIAEWENLQRQPGWKRLMVEVAETRDMLQTAITDALRQPQATPDLASLRFDAGRLDMIETIVDYPTIRVEHLQELLDNQTNTEQSESVLSQEG